MRLHIMNVLRNNLRFLLFVVIGMILLGAGLAAHQYASEHPNVITIFPNNTRQPERCLTCHAGIETISASHPVDTFGCVSCHGGDGLAVEESAAHIAIVRNPGDLAVADKYCGACHPAQTAVVPRSVMATYSGAITLIRRAFGEQADDQAHFATVAIDTLGAFHANDSDPAPIQHFEANCLTCHLNTESIQQPYFYRNTGCSTCHVLYGNDGLYTGNDPSIPKDQAGYPQTHEMTKQIPYTQCNHCHNRGYYDLRSMTFVPRTDMPASHDLTADIQRLLEYYQPIGQFTRCEYELDCIDCHTKLEVMGDGVLHNNKIEAQYVRCATCHGTTDALPTQIDVASAFAAATPSAPIQTNASAVLITNRGEVLPNIQLVNGKWLLTSKVSEQLYAMPVVKGSQCQQNHAEQNSSACHECHSVDRAAAQLGKAP